MAKSSLSHNHIRMPAVFGIVVLGTEGPIAAGAPQVEGGSKGEGRQSTMGQNQQAQNDVEQMAAPEGDRVLEGGFL